MNIQNCIVVFQNPETKARVFQFLSLPCVRNVIFATYNYYIVIMISNTSPSPAPSVPFSEDLTLFHIKIQTSVEPLSTFLLLTCQPVNETTSIKAHLLTEAFTICPL